MFLCCFFTLSCPTNTASSDHLVSPRLIICFNCHAIKNKNRNQYRPQYRKSRMYSSRHCPQNLWSHLVRTGSFDARKHIMQWRSSPGGLMTRRNGTERLFGTSAIAETETTSSPGSCRLPIWRQRERCINATPSDGRVPMRLNYRIFFNYNEQQFITRMGEHWAPEHLISQKQFQNHLNSLLLIG